MYLVVMISNNRVIHTRLFDDTVWEKASIAWDMAVAHANGLVSKLGCQTPDNYWTKDCSNNNFIWCDVSVNIEKAYTAIKDYGAISIAKAYADAQKMTSSRA